MSCLLYSQFTLAKASFQMFQQLQLLYSVKWELMIDRGMKDVPFHRGADLGSASPAPHHVPACTNIDRTSVWQLLDSGM